MRYFKHFLAALLILAIGAIPSVLMKGDHLTLLWSFTGVLILFQLVSFANRHKIKWKTFYTSPLNLLTAKNKEIFDFEISQSLLFDKVQEILKENKMSIESIDLAHHILLTTTSMSLKSWSENLYITVNKTGVNSSQLVYESVAFGVYSWGKNEDNATDFKNQLEESFII